CTPPALHPVHAAETAVVAKPVLIEEVTGAPQLRSPERLDSADALVAEVVDRVTDPLERQYLAVLLVQQHGHQPGLPVVAVDDIWALAGLEQEFQRGLREQGEPLGIVVIPVQAGAPPEVLPCGRLGTRTLPPL